ncbi:hypothetical protein SATMO3_21780 [Sporomusa aerivorans]
MLDVIYILLLGTTCITMLISVQRGYGTIKYWNDIPIVKLINIIRKVKLM